MYHCASNALIKVLTIRFAYSHRCAILFIKLNEWDNIGTYLLAPDTTLIPGCERFMSPKTVMSRETADLHCSLTHL